MKTCNKCGESKSLDLFPPDKKGKHGRKGICRACKAQDERHKDWNVQERRQMQKTAAIQQLLLTKWG